MHQRTKLKVEFKDQTIIHAFEEGKMEECFRMILSIYKEKLYWHIRKIVLNHADADDAVQTTFIQIWKNLSKFNQESKLSTWVYRIATNEALQLIRKRKPNVSLEEFVFDQLESNSSSTIEIEGDEIERKLNEAVLTLPNKQRMVFNMKYFDDLKYQEISDILETSVGGLKASYHLAVKKIQEYLKDN